MGFVVVAHPFHPRKGQHLEVLFVKRRGAGRVFVCAGTVGGQVTLPESWTDRGDPPGAHRLSVQGLADLVAAVRARLARGEQVAAVIAEISAINAELLARRELR